ncbi:MAG: TetR/AcrR family transcriptional regulator [Gammaproteobacteria bacterium]|nr:TetR/AcrR family transcriptional regulator [Gammaproteobacteria bacterium]
MDATETLTASRKPQRPDPGTQGGRGGRREKRKQEIRGRIQEAAYALFKDRGIKDTSIEQICVAADVARRTFYGYYPDKQALLRELSRTRVFNTAEGMIEEIMTNHHTTRARVSAMIDYMEGNIASYSDIDRKLILVVPSSLEEENYLRDISLSIQDQFREVFRAGQTSGDLSQRYSPDILSEMIVGTLNNVLTSWATRNDYPVFDKLEEARALFDGILSQT